jgi:hypothetical protein
MRRYDEKRSNAKLYARVEALQLTAGERAVALQAMQDGTMIADAILWVADGIKHLFAGVALKPGLKH